MHILIPAIVDIRKTAPNRLHQFIRHLSTNHKITVVCINDFWKSGQVDNRRHYQDFSDTLNAINIVYFTQKKMSPIFQEILSPLLLCNLKNDGYDIIFNYNTLVSGQYLAKKFRIPMVYDIADDLPAMIQWSPQIPAPLKMLGRWFGEYKVKRTIACSRSVTGTATQFKEKYSIPDTKFYHIPNGVDTTLFRKVDSSVCHDLGLGGSFVLGYVGVLREWVDLTPVYQTLKKLPNSRLLIVGQEGAYLENMNLVKKLGIEDNVVFTGNIPYEKVPDYIAAMDVCLIPFKKNDITENAVPLKLFEYMACEKPVVSSNIESVQQIVRDRIFYADTAQEYTALLKRFINKDPELSDLLKKNRRFIEDNFTWARIGNSLEVVLDGIL
jgi:glycosyltransferase involved in cell wall biosynthesis